MTTINSYLTFEGNCEEAFNFYKSVFGGEFSYIGRFEEMPPMEEMPPLREEDKKKIMHVSLPVGNSVLMGSDTCGDWAPQFIKGNNISLSISANSKEEANRMFDALSKGGKVIMPLEDTFWGDYYGMFTDKFGINWMISVSQK